jgi:PIN domain-containing protein
MPRPREAPVFFIDHCLGTEKVAQRLRQAGVDARVLVDQGFSADSEDVDWLPVVAADGWAILTKDKRIRRRAIEREAINESRAGAFILTASGLGGDAIAEAFARALPRMVRIWNTRGRPFIAMVSAHGGVKVIEGGARLAAVKRD